jgi:hypothetical protein
VIAVFLFYLYQSIFYCQVFKIHEPCEQMFIVQS